MPEPASLTPQQCHNTTMPADRNAYSVLDGLYDLGKTVGTGGFAKVKMATHILTGEKVAIKIMDKKQLGEDLPRIRLEILAMKELAHQNICKLLQVMETDTKIFMVLEYCPGGELFDYIVDRDRLCESESRTFFRQIVASVAYIHELGYAHRDLKPENILIGESDQQLKLIDFGLCANPQGGMTAVLETCCGSPAYAAPELVSGRAYLGAEADIWSMGVLLYALLCGFLPFDDENISVLYRKIQIGIYDKPNWLTEGSLSILEDMLQIDPKRRITVKKLLTHDWLTDGGQCGPVKWQSKYHVSELDNEVVCEIAAHKLIPPLRLAERIKRWDYCYLTATYFLLLNRKLRGLSIRLTLHGLNILDLSPFQETALTDKSQPITSAKRNILSEVTNQRIVVEDSPTTNSLETGLDNMSIIETDSITGRSRVDFDRSGRNRGSERYPVPYKKATMTKVGDEGEKENTPSRSENCKPSVTCTPIKVSSATTSITPSRAEQHLSPSRSFDSGLSGSGSKTPIRGAGGVKTTSVAAADWVFATPERPPSAKSSGTNNRKVFGSIERGLDKVKNILTPKRSRSGSMDGPVMVTGKALCNVSTTSQHNPDAVLNELCRALVAKGIPCRQKGYILRGKVKDPIGVSKLSFELEVCRIPNLNVIGIRRKRLKGDAWCYKKVCEEVLRMAAV